MKKMSEAYRKVNDYRDMMNKGRIKILARDLSCACYTYNNKDGLPCVIGYVGRSKKSAFNYRYKTKEARTVKIVEWMGRYIELSKKQSVAKLRNVVVGSILKACWGYDQTTIDFFKVTALIGKTMVEVVEIGATQSESGGMNGLCVPDPEKIIGKPMRRKCDGDKVKIDDSVRAYLMEPKEIAGCQIYEVSSWSATH
jgi:hypothetical protein